MKSLDQNFKFFIEKYVKNLLKNLKSSLIFDYKTNDLYAYS